MVQPIDIVRGTTLPLTLEVTDANGSLRSLAAGESIILGVKKKPKEEETPIFILTAVAQAEAGQYTFTIYPENTQDLEPGKYWYDVGLASGGDYFSIVEISPFDILPNVTKRGDAA